MDRIAAIRTVDDALAAFERGEIDLDTMEERVQGVLRTFATDYPADGTRAYRASGDPRADGLIVLAGGREEARERVVALLNDEDAPHEAGPVGGDPNDEGADHLDFEVTPVS